MEPERTDESTAQERVKSVTILGVTAATDLTRVQGAVAEAVAGLQDWARVEVAFALEPGTVEAWMRVPDFEALVEYRKSQKERYADPDVDYGRALTDQQRRAARYMELDDMTQEEAGSKAGTTARTIRNWENDPFFTAYRAQLSAEREAEEARERREERQALAELRRETRVQAVRNLHEAVLGKNLDVSRHIGLELLKGKN